jgi:hypothetical protein
VTVEVLAAVLKDKKCCPHAAHEHQMVLGTESLPEHVPSACWDLALEHQGHRLDVKSWCAACHGEREASRKVVRIAFPGFAA